MLKALDQNSLYNNREDSTLINLDQPELPSLEQVNLSKWMASIKWRGLKNAGKATERFTITFEWHTRKIVPHNIKNQMT